MAGYDTSLGAALATRAVVFTIATAKIVGIDTCLGVSIESVTQVRILFLLFPCLQSGPVATEFMS